jgi:hypothetical protein
LPLPRIVNFLEAYYSQCYYLDQKDQIKRVRESFARERDELWQKTNQKIREIHLNFRRQEHAKWFHYKEQVNSIKNKNEVSFIRKCED